MLFLLIPLAPTLGNSKGGLAGRSFRYHHPSRWPRPQTVLLPLERANVLSTLPRAKHELTDEQARYLTHLDGKDCFALVVLNPQRPVEIVLAVRCEQ